MQPGAGTGQAGRLNDYQKEEPRYTSDKKNNSGKSIAQATDPFRLSDI